jgi:hypothetical protein
MERSGALQLKNRLLHGHKPQFVDTHVQTYLEHLLLCISQCPYLCNVLISPPVAPLNHIKLRGFGKVGVLAAVAGLAAKAATLAVRQSGRQGSTHLSEHVCDRQRDAQRHMGSDAHQSRSQMIEHTLAGPHVRTLACSFPLPFPCTPDPHPSPPTCEPCPAS